MRSFILFIFFGIAFSRCPEEYTLGPDGNCYQVSYAFNPHSWYQSQFGCSGGGFLASVKDAFTNNFLSNLTSYKNFTYWLGGSFVDSSWKWLDCTSVNYTNWVSGSIFAILRLGLGLGLC
jgi:hypothetical protein